MNIPIYRAKKIDSDDYVVGQYIAYKGYPTIFNEYGLDGVNIDDATLAIHFPNMIDSKGNKIFASLQEGGCGGDIMSDEGCEFVLSFNGRDYELMLKTTGEYVSSLNYWEEWDTFTKIGIR